MQEREAVPFKEVLRAELEQIARLRSARGRAEAVPPEGEAQQRAHGAALVGLAFSGGGIRSATFNLGVVQGLAKLRLLPLFDYLSTVSGGGYIGSWFTVWLRRRGWSTVLASLSPAPARGGSSFSPEPREVAFLRDYSNYINPRKGLFSGDTWAMITTYMRNLMLNLLILVFALSAVLIATRFFAVSYRELALYAGDEYWLDARWYVLALMMIAIIRVRWYLSTLFDNVSERRLRSQSDTILMVFVSVIAPILVSAWVIAAWLGSVANRWITGQETVRQDDWLGWACATGVLYLGVWLVAWAVGAVTDGLKNLTAATVSGTAPRSRQVSLKQAAAGAVNLAREVQTQFARFGRQTVTLKFWSVMLSAFVAGAIAGPLLLVLTNVMMSWLRDGQSGIVHVASFAMPMVVLIFAGIAVLHIGFAGRGFNEEAREWWSRLGAHLLLANSTIAALFTVAFYSPWLIAHAQDWVSALLASGWLATSVGGLMSGRAAADGTSGLLRKVLMAVSPYVFVVGVLVALAWVLYLALPVFAPSYVVQCESADYWCNVTGSLDTHALWYAILCLVLSVVLSWRIGINDFSIHAFYGNRLVRAYLGASNRRRAAHPFTGFDPTDNDTLLQDLADKAKDSYVGPYPIINAAINLTHGARLAWQQRKADSFVFTPLYCGYEMCRTGTAVSGGYRPSHEYGGSVSVGKAMAISGAAASPNMGYHSSPPLAFLMTVFNVRLGWWMGNPGHAKTWRRPGPVVGLFYFLCELLGLANDQRGYVYLSDGGHFENLGLYELVRRRCRYVLVCDAGEDHDMTFGDLGSAVERIRADFGIDIDDLDVSPIRRGANGYSRWHCAVGRIRYSKVDRGARDGWLVYVKSSVTGNEPMDVTAYREQYKEFPHEPTSDQWFDEAQFESYRALGEHVIRTVLGGAENGKPSQPTARQVFQKAAGRLRTGSRRRA